MNEGEVSLRLPKWHEELKVPEESGSDVQLLRWAVKNLIDPSFVPTADQTKYFIANTAHLSQWGEFAEGTEISFVDKIIDQNNSESNFASLFPEYAHIPPGLSESRGYVDPHDETCDYIVPPGDSRLQVLENDFYQRYGLEDTQIGFRVVTRAMLGRMRENGAATEVLTWYFDNYEHILDRLDLEDSLNMMDVISGGIETSFAAVSNRIVAEKMVDTLNRLITTAPENPSEDWVARVDSILGGPVVAGYQDMRYLIYRGLASRGSEARAVGGYLMGNDGLALVLDSMRHLYFDQNLPEEERQKAYEWLVSFWQGIVPIREGKIHLDEMQFYDSVPDEARPMTEELEGNKRTEQLVRLFTQERLSADDLILDVACGTGWLTDRLRKAGFNCKGVDLNDGYLATAQALYGDNFLKGDMKSLHTVINDNNLHPRAVVINGRSVHHLEKMRLLGGTQAADLVVFDALDPMTGIQHTRLNQLREKMTEYGYSKEWLEKYFWNILGSIDGGNNLGDRVAPPQEWWKDYWELCGYDVEVIREENYDGQSTDNLVFICRRIKDVERQKVVKEAARDRKWKRCKDEPKNGNRFSLQDNRNFRVYDY